MINLNLETKRHEESNLIQDDVERHFFVWIDKFEKTTMTILESTGRFESEPELPDLGNFVFIDKNINPPRITPFHSSLIREYRHEWGLEHFRRSKFPQYPSRFTCIFLFENEQDARKYKELQPGHVEGRGLVEMITEGSYTFSKHDIGWLQALFSNVYNDLNTFTPIATNYWQGNSSNTEEAIHTRVGDIYVKSLFEILYYGTVRLNNWEFGKEITYLES